MPSTTLSALNDVTLPVTPEMKTSTINVSGDFVGKVRIERRANLGVPWAPIALNMQGLFVDFTGPSGDIPVQGIETEPFAQIRARMVEYTNGTALVRIGR